MARLCIPLLSYPDFKRVLSELKLDCLRVTDFNEIRFYSVSLLLPLREINLSNVPLNKKSSKELFSFLQENNKKLALRIFNLSNTGINHHDMIQLGSFLKKYTHIKELYLDNNPLGGKNIFWRIINKKSGVEILASNLYDYQSLHRLSLKNTGSDKIDIQSLGDLMDSLSAFVKLSLEEKPSLENFPAEIKPIETQARNRAELLEASPMSTKFVYWQEKMRNCITCYEILNKSEQKADEHVSNQDKSINWNEFYQLTSEMLEAFIPGDRRKKHIQDKIITNKPLDLLESYQWRAITAKHKLDEANIAFIKDNSQKLYSFAELCKLWSEFAINKKLMARPDTEEAYESTPLPIIPEHFLTWQKICEKAHERVEIEAEEINFSDIAYTRPSKSLFKDWPFDMNFSQAKWFRVFFGRTLYPYWIASSSIASQLIGVSRKHALHERISEFIINSGLHVADGLMGMGHLIKELHEITKLTHLESIKGLADVIELLDHLKEGGAEIPIIYHLIHKNDIKRWLVNKLFRVKRSWLYTDEKLDNLYQTFEGRERDFDDKMMSCIVFFIHLYESSLKQLTNKSAVILANYCAKHLLNGLMLGFFRSFSSEPVLSLEEFRSLALHWLTSIPADESSPRLQTKAGVYISADSFLRNVGLRAMSGNTEVIFYWEKFKATILDSFHPYTSHTEFSYQPDPACHQSRLATEKEVNYLNNQLSIGLNSESKEEVIVGKESGKEIAKLTWQVNPAVLSGLRKHGITAVKAISSEWKTAEERMAILEKENCILMQENQRIKHSYT